jgi:hypothetical protein
MASYDVVFPLQLNVNSVEVLSHMDDEERKKERERRSRVYKEAPGFRIGPREREKETLPRV